MSRYFTITAIICTMIIGVFSVQAEKETELYIPIGHSPGLSGKYTVMGKIDQVDSKNQSIIMSGSSGSYSVQLTPDTSIYLDRSKAKLPNPYGTLADCKAGDTFEVKFEDNSHNKPAQWIKVEKAK